MDIEKNVHAIFKVLFLGPHTDDIELGAGGTLTKFLEKNYEVMLVVFSTAEESLPKDMPRDTLKNEFLNVIADLKIERFKIFNFQIRKLNFHRQEILEKMVRIRDQFKPDLVVGPSLNDFHQDHRTVSEEMVRAFKTSSSIICYELPLNHLTFNTQLFVKLKKHHVKSKTDLLSHYKSQIIQQRRYFSKEYIFGLAKVRGTQCNAEYAEAFEVLRWIM